MTGSLEPGHRLDRFEVEGVLGRGGFATVYKVRHVHLGTRHALKVLAVPSTAEQARLIREGRTQAALRHPNVVTVTDVVEVGSGLGLVMDLVRGPDLATWLSAHQPTLAELDDLAAGILAGVEAAHALGVVHRDLKPGNVLLDVHTDRIVPRIADFGLVTPHTFPDSVPHTVGLVGTLAYAAPEQVSGGSRVDHRADIFALGALLYEVATRSRAFQGLGLLDVLQAAAKESYVPPRQLRPDLPERVEHAIVGALRPDPRDRWPDVAALRKAWFDAPLTTVSSVAWSPSSVALAKTLTPSAVGPSSPVPTPLLSAPPSGGMLPAAALLGASLVMAALIVVIGPSWRRPADAPATPGVVVESEPVTVAATPPPADVALAPSLPAPETLRAAAIDAAPRRVRAAPAAASAPPAPPPQEAPAPAVADEALVPAPPAPARVVLRGDADQVTLTDAGGRRHQPGSVPAGRYLVGARFARDDAPVQALALDLAPGDQVELRCQSGLRRCSAAPLP